MGIGFYSKRMNRTNQDRTYKNRERQEPAQTSENRNNKDIERRLESIERMLFEKQFSQEQKAMEKNSTEIPSQDYSTRENVDKINGSMEIPEKVRRILELDQRGMTIEEIARAVRMQKGEVILLKDLYKDYFS